MLFRGDCLEVLRTIPDNSVDSLVTDPPAGIGFMGKEWDSAKGGRAGWVSWMTEVMRECLRVMKPGAHGLVWAIPRTSHWTATALEDAGFEVRDVITHLFGQGFPKSLDISKAIDKAAGAEREVIADAAKQWAGWGTSLKPAVERWLLVQKPLTTETQEADWSNDIILVRKPCEEKTVASNVLEWGTGGINIDGCRVPGKLEGDPNRFSKAYSMGEGHEGWKRKAHENYTAPVVRSEGRFPANLVLSHSPYCTDDQCDIECAIERLDEQSGELKSGKPGVRRKAHDTHSMAGRLEITGKTESGIGDSGGASRFFYCAKISSGERGKENNHPTVKPQKLMRYLCRLITPPGGIVLDPFMGSGSTGMAAKSEGFEFIGIEKEDEYFSISEKRIAATISNS